MNCEIVDFPTLCKASRDTNDSPAAKNLNVISNWVVAGMAFRMCSWNLEKIPNLFFMFQDNPQENRTSPKKKKEKTFGSLNAQKEAFDSLQAQKEAYGIMKELQTERKTRDNFSVFGEYIACRLRNLQDPLTISTVQNQIHNIIFQAEMNLYSGGANRIGSYSGSANTIGSNSDSASTSFNRGYYTSSFLNNSSDPADLPHMDTDSSQISEDLDDILLNIQQSQGNDKDT
ncbi:hypothetical protein EVAR_88946_1 [Eumeta japonica]|uniref:BESS domain-containing protein n=1 Tax=Eumeta variegata TaxID=151549 RepID=A0A4C1VSV3_EUMVA|nr:hypothetical protein EVAR_88946_1 [Eumeta japonica]